MCCACVALAGYPSRMVEAASLDDNEPEIQPNRLTIRPCGASTSLWLGATSVDIPRGEAALVALLVALDRPVSRTELARAASVSRRSVASMLSRVAARLAIADSLHVAIGTRSGLIAANPAVTHIDVADVVWLPGRALPCLLGLGLAETDPLVTEARGQVRALLQLAPRSDVGTTVPGGTPHRRSAILAAAASGQRVVDDELARHLAAAAGVELGPVASHIGADEHGHLYALSPSDRQWMHRTAADHLASRVPPPLLRLAHHAARSNDTGGRHRALALIVDQVRAHLDTDELRPISADSQSTIEALIDAAWEMAPGPDTQIDLLMLRAEFRVRAGPWMHAREAYQQAIDAAAAVPDAARLASAALGMATATWDEGAARQADGALSVAAETLGSDADLLRARVRLCMAGGLYQSGWVSEHTPELVSEWLATADRALDRKSRAWATMHARKAELGRLDPERSYHLALRLGDLGAADRVLAAHGHLAAFVDALRLGRLGWARRHLAALRSSDDATPDQVFSKRAAMVCWDLAVGRFQRAEEGLNRLQQAAPALPAQTSDQVLLGQHMGLAIERGDQLELSALADAAAASTNGLIWHAGHAHLATAAGRHGDARKAVEEIASVTDGFRTVPTGAHRLPVLAIAADALWHQPGQGDDWTRSTASQLAAELRSHPEAGVLVGWPTLYLGPTERFRAMAEWLAGRPMVALVHANAALTSDRWCAPHLAKSLAVSARLAAATGDDIAAERQRTRTLDIRGVLADRW